MLIVIASTKYTKNKNILMVKSTTKINQFQYTQSVSDDSDILFIRH